MPTTYPFIALFEEREDGDYDFLLAVEREKLFTDEKLKTFLYNLGARRDIKSLPFETLRDIPDVLMAEDVLNQN